MATVKYGFQPHPYQKEVMDNLKRWNILLCHRRFGKTVLSLNLLVLAALVNPSKNARYAYLCPTQKQAKSVAWDYLKDFTKDIPGTKPNETELRIDLPNGARISLCGNENRENLRGLYLDEFSDCHPDLISTIIEPTLADRNGFLIILGTPKGRDHFFEEYNRALRDQEWYCRIFKLSETNGCGTIPLSEVQRIREKGKRPDKIDAFNQEYECSFDVSAGDVVIPLESINPAIGRQIGYLTMGKVMGVDVGMSMGGDPSAIVIRQGGQVTHMEEFNMTDSIQIAGKVRDTFYDHEANHIVIDALTWGKGVFDILASWGLPVTGINVSERAAENERFANSRAELWFKTRDFFEEKQCSLPADHPLTDKLVAELSNLTYSHTPSGKRKVESKPDLAKRGVPSPNLADAFVLTMDSSAVGAIAFGRLEVPEQQSMLL